MRKIKVKVEEFEINPIIKTLFKLQNILLKENNP